MAAVSITSPIMHRLRILFLRFYTPPDSFLSILLFRLGPLVECDCARLLTTVKADGLQSALRVSVPFPLKGERGMKASDRLRNRVLIRRVEAKEKTPGGIIIPDTA